MTNAKEEFEDHVSFNLDNNKAIVKAAAIANAHYTGDGEMIASLKVGYSVEEYYAFLEELNFEYDSGYGSQNLTGCIWYEDGTWSERGEYDGSEWWEYNSVPDIPEELK